MSPAILALLPLVAAGPLDAYGDPLPRGVVARLGSVRWRCPDPPEHLIWSPDGKYLAGTHGGIGLTIWAYPAGVVARRIELPELSSEAAGPLTADQVRWMPDSRHLLVYGGDNRLVRVDVATGKTERVDTGIHRGVAVAISADRRRALLEVPGREEEGDKWSELWALDLDRPQRLRALWKRRVVSRVDRGLMGHEDRAAPAAQITADGRFVVATSVRQYDISYAVFDLGSGRSWLPPDDTFRGMALSPDGRTFLSTDPEGRLTRWAFASATWLRPFPVAGPIARSPDEWYLPAQPSPDGRVVVQLGPRVPDRDKHAERSIVVLDTETLRPRRAWFYRPGDECLVRKGGTPVFTRDGVGGLPGACAVVPDDRTLAVASIDSPRLRFFDMTSGHELRPVGGHAAAVLTLRRVGSKLTSVSSDQVGRVWEFPGRDRGPAGRTTQRELGVFDRWDEDDGPPIPRKAARFKVLYDRDRHRIEARDIETETIIWDQPVPGGFVPHPDRPRTFPIVEDSDWDRVAFALGESVTVCELETGEPLAEVRAPGCWPTAIEFDRDPGTLIVGYHDGQVLVWDLHPDRPRLQPSDADLARLWADLAGPPADAARARSVFFDHPAVAVRWLHTHLRPLGRPTEDDVVLWLARLAHPRYAVREEATRLLVRHFDVAGPEATQVLALTKSPEVEQRLRAVLDRHGRFGGDAEVVRLLRAVAILEHVGTADARELLLRVARGGGVPAARATDALARLKGRPANQANVAVVETDGTGGPGRRAR